MSFIYKAMMTRGPNKRRIKVNEENLAGLMTNNEDDEEEEEDEDFTIPDEQDEDGDESDSEESHAESSTSASSEEDDSADEEEDRTTSKKTMDQSTSSKKKKQTNHSKPLTSKKVSTQQTVGELQSQIMSEYYGLPNSTAEILTQAKRQLKQSENAVKNMSSWPDSVCSVCLNEEQTNVRNQILTCQKCGISVHEDCYNMQHKLNNRSDRYDIWICESCIYGGNDVVCQFCPNTWGLMKETKCGRWCHLVCARNILADFLYNSPANSRRSPNARNTIFIKLNDCNNKMFGAKDCVLCQDRLVSKTGICIKCDAGLCKSTFHVTCAQRHGLLSKVVNTGDSNNNTNNGGETYYANCPLHSIKEEMKKRQKKFILHLKISELERQKFSEKGHLANSIVSRRISELRQIKKRRNDSYIPPRPPLEQIPRLLSSDAHFTRLLNDKAEKMFGMSTKCPATIIPKATEIRKRHNVAPSLTTDFSAYFIDRELRIQEEKSCLESATKTNRELSEKQEWERQIYNERQKSMNELKADRNFLKNDIENLKQLFNSVVEWAKNPQSSISPIVGSNKRKSLTPRKVTTLESVSPSTQRSSLDEDDDNKRIREMSTSPLSPVSMKDPDAESIIELKSCGICKGQENQHLLARCDVCNEWQHLACLDPPLTQMPKRTKFSLWQCSECADTSGSSSSDNDVDNHGTFTGQDGRRVTRRFRRVPDKLAVGFPDDNKGVKKTESTIGFTKIARKRRKKMLESMKKKKAEIKQTVEHEKESSPLNIKAAAPYSTPATSFQSADLSSDDDIPLLVKRQSKLQRDLQRSLNSQPAKFKVVTSTPMSTSITSSTSLTLTPTTNTLKFSKPSKVSVINKTSKKVSNYPVGSKLRKIIILKKRIASPHRPIGLGRGKKILSFPSKETRKVLIPIKTPQKVTGTSVTNSPQNNAAEVLPLGTILPLPSSRDVDQFKTTNVLKAVDITKNFIKKVTPVKKVVKRVRYCDICNSRNDDEHIVTCETCKKNYHWECCDPPLKSNPVKKWAAWECSNCVDEREEREEEELNKQEDESISEVSSSAGRVRRKRKPPQVFEPDFNVSTQQKIFRSIEKKKMKRKSIEIHNMTPDKSLKAVTLFPSAEAARCRPMKKFQPSHQFNISSLKLTPTSLKIPPPYLSQWTPPHSYPKYLPPTSKSTAPPIVVLPASTSKIKILNPMSGLDFANFKTISVIKPPIHANVTGLPVKLSDTPTGNGVKFESVAMNKSNSDS